MPIASELTIDNTASATTLMQTIFGSGVTITAGTASLTGAGTQSGTYSGGTATLGEIAPADTGIILSTGNVADFTNSSGTLDTNTTSGTSSAYGGAGDADLDTVTGQATEDAVVLSADFTTTGDFITMQFTFSSEEYLEYVNGGVNDAFGVWVNDVYAPFTPATNNLVSIDTINDTESSNLYLNNDAALDTYNTEMDGTTVTVSIKAAVNSVGSNTIKIALADGGDDEYDSNVLIAANSVQTVALAFDDTLNMLPSSTATFDLLANDTDTTGTGLTITEINGQSIVAGGSVTLPTGESVTLNADNTITVTNDGDIGSEAFTYKVLDGAGNTDIGFATINTTTTLPLDYIVEGGAGSDLIDSSYVGDREGDRIDNLDHSDASNDDSVLGGSGDDTIISGLGDDTIYGDTGVSSAVSTSGPELISNGSFEDGTHSADGVGGLTDWSNTSGSPDSADDGAAAESWNPANGATDGTGYITMWASSTGPNESMQQTLAAPLEAGTTYSLSVNAISADTIGGTWFTPSDIPVEFEILDAATGTVLGSITVQGTSYEPYTFEFTPTADVSTIIIRPNTAGSGSNPSVIIDELSLTEVLPAALTNDDSIDSGDGADLVFGETGDDTISSGAGDDTVSGGAGSDRISSGSGADYIDGGTEDDLLSGNDGDDTILGGDGADILEGEDGADSIVGGSGNDTLIGYNASNAFGGSTVVSADDGASDILIGGAGDDDIYAGSGSDTLDGGTGNDLVFGAGGDDAVVLNNDFGNDTIAGGETGETSGDTLDLSAVTDDLTVDLSAANPETGTVSDGTGTASFTEIENITLGAGADTLILADGGGADAVSGFNTADSGDGTTVDQLDVSGLTSDGGTTPVTTSDVTVSDDGSGNAVLTFPGGESLTLLGVAPTEVDTPAELEAIGIPGAALNYIVEGGGGADTIDASFLADPEGDRIDNLDHSDGSNADSVEAGAGADVIDAGLGDDTIDAGDGADTILDSAGDDSVLGGEGKDNFDYTTLTGNDTIVGGEINDTTPTDSGDKIDAHDGVEGLSVVFSGDEAGTVTGASGTVTFSEIEHFMGGQGSDTIDASASSVQQILDGGEGSDTIQGGSGDDIIAMGMTQDFSATDGDDDLLVLEDGFGNDSIEGFEVPTDLGGGTYSGNDQVDVSGLTDAGGDPVNTGDVTVTDTNGDGTGDAILTFPNGESITLWGVLASEVESPAQLQAIGIPAEPVTINDAILLDALPGGSDTLTAGSELLSVTDGLEFDVGTAGSLNIGDTTVIGGVTYTISQILAYEADMTNTGGTAGTETIGYFIIELDDGAGTTIPYMLLGDEFSDKELITEVVMQFTSPAVGGIPIAGYDDDDVVTLAPSAALNYIVEGTAGADTIDASYTGDPEGDMVDAGDNLAGNDDDSIVAGGGADFVDGDDGDDTIDAGDGDDTVLGGLGDDSILGGLGNDNIMAENGSDTIYAGEGDDTVGASIGGDLVYGEGGNDSLTGGGYAVGPGDTIYGGTGNDTISGGGGADSLYGDEDDDSIDGGVGDDTLEGGTGNDTLDGGDGNDSINGDVGDDSIVGGAGDDFLRGSFGDDTLVGGTGDDTLWGGFGDDSIVVDADFGDYIIEGEEEAEVLGDTMDVSAVTDDLTWDLTNANPEAGSFTDGTNTGTYVDIENIILGSGTDTLTLGTFGGSDTVTGFTAPTDTGGGTFSGNDMLDVSGLLDFDGNPTHTGNVTVADDGSGNAQLTFANGETLTLVGVAVGDVSSPAQLIAMGIPEGPDGYVDGTSGDDTIDSSYTGDPNFDLVDNNDALLPGMSGDDDYIRAGAGNDSVVANIGNDIVDGGTGDDTIEGGTGDDTLSGEADDDSLVGGLGNDSLIGGAGDDTLNGQIGDDVLEGGDGSDSFALEDDFGSDTIIGGEVDDVAGDVLDLSAVGGALTYDLTGTDAESGTVTDGTGTIEFSEIETIQLSSGTDTLTLANGSGDDVVTGFTAPVLDGGGSYIGFDQLDVSTMTDANGAMVNTGDVTITDTNGDGTGDTILTFPGGETLTLVGVLPSAFPVPEALAAIGIPLADYIVEGTAAGEVIDGSYMGDPEGDLVDAGDAENGSDDDVIEAGAGADTVTAGAGNDSVFGDEGEDEISAGAGDDTVFGGDDNDTISGGADNDSLLGQDGADSIAGDAGDDYLEGGIGEDTLEGGADNDTLDGGADNDLLDGGAGNDSLLGSFGDDTLRGGAGNDTMSGGFGDDTFELSDGFGDDIIDGEADFETNGDTLDASGVTAEGVSIVYSGDESGTLTGAVTGDEADFFDIENVTATDNDDTINAALDTVGVNVDAGDGEDVVTGGSGEDTLDGGDGDDVLSGGTDGDLITAGTGDDTINVAQGDTVTGGDGDDFFNLVDLGEVDTDTITITGGEGGETDGDTLALNGLHDRDSLVITDPDDVNGGLSGTVTLLDGTVVNFTNIENIICFVPGTEIATPYGARMIEDLSIGDHVVTQDNGVQRIRWIGTTTVPATDKFAPVRFDQSTFPGASADLVVSPQHRMLFKGYQAELLFGENEVLIPAIHLIDGKSVQREAMETVTYIHIMFEQHEIIFAQGVATESFHPGSFGVDCLAPKARDELFTLFPQMRSDLSSYGQSARTSLRATEAKVLMRF